MNNLFLEGPVQTGKSTLIRKILTGHFGPTLEGVGGFTCQRISFPTPGNDRRFGFRLMPASAPISARTCVVADDDALISSEGIFKVVSADGSRTDLNVFETTGVSLIKEAIDFAKAGQISLVLLDEIGGHEMTCDRFRTALYEILDSSIPCIGVIKSPDSTEKMVSKLPAEDAKAIIDYNARLHNKIAGENNSSGEIIQFARDDESVASKIEKFIRNNK